MRACLAIPALPARPRGDGHGCAGFALAISPLPCCGSLLSIRCAVVVTAQRFRWCLPAMLVVGRLGLSIGVGVLKFLLCRRLCRLLIRHRRLCNLHHRPDQSAPSGRRRPSCRRPCTLLLHRRLRFNGKLLLSKLLLRHRVQPIPGHLLIRFHRGTSKRHGAALFPSSRSGQLRLAPKRLQTKRICMSTVNVWWPHEVKQSPHWDACTDIHTDISTDSTDTHTHMSC